MSIFETIFQEMLNIKNNEKNKKNKKQLVPKMFLFLHYFTPSNFSNRDSLTWQKYIKYKYFILTNYLHVNKNNLIDNAHKIYNSIYYLKCLRNIQWILFR
jgi:hypothetical protein